MPLQHCETEGRPGWQWGDQGACYGYTAGDDASSLAAKKKALKQAAAMGDLPGTVQRSASPPEIFLRSRAEAIDDVSFKDRTIDVIAMPWDVESEVGWRGQVWRELFLRGAFNDAIQSGVRIPVNRQHDKADTIGRITKLTDTPKAAIAAVKVAKTPRGDDTLQLASEGMLGGSVGYFLKRQSDMTVDRRGMRRIVKRAFLDHFAMVDGPNFPGAETIAVHDDLPNHPEAGLRPLVTPALDEWTTDPILGWAAQHK